MIRAVIFWFGVLCVGFTALQYITQILWATLSGRLLRDHRSGSRPLALAKITSDDAVPGVTMILPAYNEEAVITHTAVSALAQEYPKLEVIIVNDGSKDNTLQVLIDRFDMEPFDDDPQQGVIPTCDLFTIYRSRSEHRIVVVDKAGSGAKADNVNVGINLASHPWVVVMDGDEFLEPDSIGRCMAEVLVEPGEIAAIGGTLLPSNSIVIDGPNIVERHAPTNYWVGCQLIEYLTAFLLARPGLARIGAMPFVSGGFGMYRRDSVVAAGGYKHGHLGEDMDMCLSVQRTLADTDMGNAVIQVPESVCWTEFPSTKDVLRRQRIRWHRGLKMALDDHGSMFGRRRYGRVGTVGIGSLYVLEWLGPLLEATGWVIMAMMLAIGWISPLGAMFIFLFTQFLGMAMTMLAVAMMTTHLRVFSGFKDTLRMMVWAIALNWGYRQLTLVWRIRSLFPGEAGWGEMPRSGFKTESSAGGNLETVNA